LNDLDLEYLVYWRRKFGGNNMKESVYRNLLSGRTKFVEKIPEERTPKSPKGDLVSVQSFLE